jgi:hypothetical protein
MSVCCDSASSPKTSTWVGRFREVSAWVVPSAVLVLVPKCPACLAAHVALWTGLGLSFSTATYLRWALLLVCVASLLLLIVKRLGRIADIFSSSNKGNSTAKDAKIAKETESLFAFVGALGVLGGSIC